MTALWCHLLAGAGLVFSHGSPRAARAPDAYGEPACAATCPRRPIRRVVPVRSCEGAKPWRTSLIVLGGGCAMEVGFWTHHGVVTVAARLCDGRCL